ncbi:hypothetical protein GCM10025880_12880 [Methylorubrum aminovorans]|nr:hypothetical protein GCM10025880_12880 [Methylorubrum aminovorans]
MERALGHQIRALRRERDLSVSDLGAAAGISPGMISKMENGQISPSLGSINAVASALNVPITALFAAFEESRDCSYVKRGQGVVIERRGTKVGHIYELLGAGLRGEIVLEPYLITLEGMRNLTRVSVTAASSSSTCSPARSAIVTPTRIIT